MCSLAVEYSCTVAVTGSAEWLQATEISLVRLDGTVSQPEIAIVSDGGVGVGGRGTDRGHT